MFPGDEYDAKLASQREWATDTIGRHGLRFFHMHLLGVLACVVGVIADGIAGVLFEMLGGSLLLYSMGLAVWLAIATFRAFSLLSWLSRFRGLLPWGVLCLEAVVILEVMRANY